MAMLRVSKQEVGRVRESAQYVDMVWSSWDRVMTIVTMGGAGRPGGLSLQVVLCSSHKLNFLERC